MPCPNVRKSVFLAVLLLLTPAPHLQAQTVADPVFPQINQINLYGVDTVQLMEANKILVESIQKEFGISGALSGSKRGLTLECNADWKFDGAYAKQLKIGCHAGDFKGESHREINEELNLSAELSRNELAKAAAVEMAALWMKQNPFLVL